MNGLEIINCIEQIPCLKYSFIGVYNNKNIPVSLKYMRNGFFIVNTIYNVNKMGHWIMYYIKDFNIYFFDSYGSHPTEYGMCIEEFYNSYPYNKIIVFDREIQDDSSYVCGVYAIYFAYSMCNNKSINMIKKKFGKNRNKNDLFVTGFLYKLLGLSISCNKNYCPSIMHSHKCKKFCLC